MAAVRDTLPLRANAMGAILYRTRSRSNKSGVKSCSRSRDTACRRLTSRSANVADRARV
eukprot:CAMPEP_0179962404 /NCGR_PEP_ID=MMETSP0983-20121128/30209_1 /TAXON_ID=483367 /ORGANISM="non described non described, Strain CCMP 2436" /LENGTH=58 /DNA_ID=CAMNT_0021874925 /DNA_START=8 /DNA_END=184 /DNA_ORIENTATION=-